MPVATLESPAAYTFDTPGVESPVATPMLDAIGGLGAVATPVNEPFLGSARGVSAAAGHLRGQLRGLVSKDGEPDYRSPVPYPKGDLAERLAAVAAMIAAGLPLRVVAVEAHDGDFDTHADQAAHFAPRIQAVGDAVLAFQRDLEARGLADRVLTQLWSEFGRRPKENGSGTDHGAAGAGFVIGTRTTGGLVGEFPGLGPVSAVRLREAGIETPEELRRLGAVEAYARLKREFPAETTHTLLYMMHGAVTGVRWHQLSETRAA